MSQTQDDLIAYQRNEIARLNTEVNQLRIKVAKGGVDNRVTFETRDGLVGHWPSLALPWPFNPELTRLIKLPLRISHYGDRGDFRTPGTPAFEIGYRTYRLRCFDSITLESHYIEEP